MLDITEILNTLKMSSLRRCILRRNVNLKLSLKCSLDIYVDVY